MHGWFTVARRHAAKIHDVVQFAAGATACAAVLVFVMLSGRSPEDPVVRWLAEVGATTAASEILVPGTFVHDTEASGTATATATATPSFTQSAAPVNAWAFESGTSSHPRHRLTNPIFSR